MGDGEIDIPHIYLFLMKHPKLGKKRVLTSKFNNDIISFAHRKRRATS